MSVDTYYLLSALPAAGALGEPPPLTLPELRAHTAETAAPEALVDAVLLSDDLLQRDAALAGELDTPTPAVLTMEQVRDDAALPPALVDDAAEGGARRLVTDHVWAAYYRYAVGIAEQVASAFLRDWVGYEVALRNALAGARAQALNLPAEMYLVADDLATSDVDFADVVRTWTAAPNPLAGLRVLDEARYAWVEENDRWYSFAVDELAAYAVKLMLLTRWARLADQE